MGFKITRDFIRDKDEKGQVGNESVRQTGLNAMFMSEEDQEKCIYKGGKIKVRLLDDDGNIYYHAHVDDDDFSCELLLDWGMGFAGCTSLDMHIESYKELFGEPKHEKLISKCGKWYSYMG
ncbi:hypothetical protein HUN92_13680 [Bacillus firmus]|uniref:hypothetical protein n=1 Tax=Cytobacillus firmus TaxID=1399 RepID=UPI001247D7DE|nr:hypothetical protein [Cytobacillus firmus]NUH84770.1 hypothetical protein [Cytobacillus firmus]